MRFSERQGIKLGKTSFQVDSIDEELRNGLWNSLALFYWKEVEWVNDYSNFVEFLAPNESLHELGRSLWLDFFKRPIDTLPRKWGKLEEELRGYFFGAEWFAVYDFVEFIATNFPKEHVNESFIIYCNEILKRELSGYRFVGGQLSPIVDEIELLAVEEALGSPRGPVQTHIAQALTLLSDRTNPDYRNSIKESISAIEALAKTIVGNESISFAKAINALEKRYKLHPSLKEALIKLYGYTSDHGGIRHALKDSPAVDLDEAKFMLVTCSAFINYIVAKKSPGTRE